MLTTFGLIKFCISNFVGIANLFSMKKRILTLFFLMLFTHSICFSMIKNTTNSPLKTIKCKTGIYIKNLRIDQANEEFTVLFYWWIRVDSIEKGFDAQKVKLIEFINSSNEVEITQEITDTVRNYYYLTGVCHSTAPFKADYHRFPYDKQNLFISLENKNHNISEILFVGDTKYRNFNRLIDRNIEILNGDQYSVTNLSTSNSRYTYNTNFGDPLVAGNDTYSRINFKIEISRNPTGIMLKLGLPLFLVLVLSYLVFFIPDHEISTASALTVTSLLAAIAFQWTINESLPKVSYYTTVDRVFYLVYSFIFYAMAQTVFTYNLSNRGQRAKKVSETIEFHSRWIFPVAFVVLLLQILN